MWRQLCKLEAATVATVMLETRGAGDGICPHSLHSSQIHQQRHRALCAPITGGRTAPSSVSARLRQLHASSPPLPLQSRRQCVRLRRRRESSVGELRRRPFAHALHPHASWRRGTSSWAVAAAGWLQSAAGVDGSVNWSAAGVAGSASRRRGERRGGSFGLWRVARRVGAVLCARSRLIEAE